MDTELLMTAEDGLAEIVIPGDGIVTDQATQMQLDPDLNLFSNRINYLFYGQH